MKKFILLSGLLGVLFFALGPIRAQDSAVTLKDVKSDNNVVTVLLSGEVKSNVYELSNPPRIVIELPGVEFVMKSKSLSVDSTLISNVRFGQFSETPRKISRVVIDLNKKVTYEAKSEGNELKIVLNPEARTAEEAATKAEAIQAAPAPAASPASELPHFKETPQTPETAQAQETPQVKEPEKDEEQVALAQPEAPAVVAAPVVEQTIQQPAKPVKKAAAKASTANNSNLPGNSLFPKTPVTFDFEDADIKDVLRILSIKAGINIIYGDDVSGTVTIRLDNVPFDRAFDTLLSLKGLVSEFQGTNIVRVATPLQIATERAQAVTFTKIFPLNYAKAENIKAHLDSIRGAEGRKGNISVDERTNSLVVTDTPEGLGSVRNVIAELDRKPQQVLIEAKIVEVSLNKSTDLGIQWNYANTPQNNPNAQFNVGASQLQVAPAITNGTVNGAATIVSPVSPQEGGTGVSFPAAGNAASIAFGLVANNTRLDGILTALSQKGSSKVLSDPKVTTLNNIEAKILVGQKIPYTTVVTNLGVTSQQVQFLDVGIKLTVTPTINADAKITLKVHPEVSLFVRADPAGPVTGTREADTTVLINNGETVVIGGLITENDQKLAEQVPMLGDIPILGQFFKRDFKNKERTELLVFITPYILE
jgi:type IV pilus assembly protein PilQ